MASSKLRPLLGRIAKLTAPLLVLAVAVLILLYLVRTRPEPPPATPEQRSWQVEQITASPQSLAPRLTAYGEVIADDAITFRAPIAGVVLSRPAKDGARVSEGALLLAMDEQDYQPAVERTQARVDELEAQLTTLNIEHTQDREALSLEQAIVTNAENTLQRNLSLLERNHASDSDVETARDALTQARLALSNRQQRVNSFESRKQALKAQIKTANAELESAQRDARRAVIHAPADGVVRSVSVAAGDRVNTNDELLRFYQPGHLELHTTLPSRFAEELRHALETDQPILAQTKASTTPQSLRLERLAGQARGEGVTGIFQFEEIPANRPGEIQSIEITRPPVDDVIALPYSAIYGNNIIYRINEDNLLERIAVEVLGNYPFDNERGVLVRGADINPGDAIAITHLPNAIDGLAVQPVADEPHATTAPLEVSP